MAPIVVWSLLVVVLSGGGVVSYAREYPTEALCEKAASAAHDAAKIAIGVIDVGTKCLKSEFDPLIKPRA